MPAVALAGTGPGAAMLAHAAQLLGWDVNAVAGDEPERLAEATGAEIVGLEELLARPSADLVVLTTGAPARARHAVSLLDAGVHVVLAPGLGVRGASAVVEAERRSPASLVMADTFPTAPAAQRWFGELGLLGERGGLSHLSGRAVLGPAAGPRLDWSLVSMTVLSARLAHWGEPVGAPGATSPSAVDIRFAATGTVARLAIERHAAEVALPEWELQAADASNALHVEMFPAPRVERNGRPLPLAAGDGPAEAFGAAPLLRMFWDDVTSARRPVLDAEFGLTVERVLAQSGSTI